MSTRGIWWAPQVAGNQGWDAPGPPPSLCPSTSFSLLLSLPLISLVAFSLLLKEASGGLQLSHLHGLLLRDPQPGVQKLLVLTEKTSEKAVLDAAFKCKLSKVEHHLSSSKNGGPWEWASEAQEGRV